ncbi:MAG: endopeptidase [Frankiales bacterium]|nr:endopeptidase [Frankiales bacterium]
MSNGRLPAAITLVVLLVALGVTIGVMTPWNPLPGKHQQVSVSRDFTPTEVAHESAFHRAVRPWSYGSMALGLVIALVLGFTSFGARLIEAVARPFGGGWPTRAGLGAVVLVLVVSLLTLPLDARSEVALRRYGLSTQNWSGWFADRAKGFGLSVVLLAVVAIVGFAVVRAWPHGWWAPLAALAAGAVVLLSFVLPVVVEPVFNTFTPMQDGPLRDSLMTLAREDGVPVKEVLVADASRRTTSLNAYVSGFGATRRIVVYDTLVEKSTPEEVRLVVAHELGHAKRKDVLTGTIEGALGAAAAVCGLYLLLSWGPLLRRAGVPSLGDPRSLALVMALLVVAGFAIGPLTNIVSRRIEARADVHSLELTHDPDVFVQSERTLNVRNLGDLNPNPFVYAMFATHPSGPERIALARTWAQQHGLPDPPSLAPAGAESP